MAGPGLKERGLMLLKEAGKAARSTRTSVLPVKKRNHDERYAKQ